MKPITIPISSKIGQIIIDAQTNTIVTGEAGRTSPTVSAQTTLADHTGIIHGDAT